MRISTTDVIGKTGRCGSEPREQSRPRAREKTPALLASLCSILLVLAAPEASATLLGGYAYLNVTIADPPDLEVFDGNAVLADAPVDFSFGDIGLDAMGDPKYVFDVDFTGADGLTVVITATRNTPNNDINGQFRSFEFTGLQWIGSPFAISNATLVGISGTQAAKWQAGATITEVGPGLFTFETGAWNSTGVVQGDTIVATIQLEVQSVPPSSDTYEYDDLDRLVRVNRPDGSSIVYTYDRAGNILSRATVPEPALATMALIGGLCLAGLGRSRRPRGRRRLDGTNAWTAGLIVALVLGMASVSFAQTARGPLRGAGWQEQVRDHLEDAEYEVTWSRVRSRRASEALQAPNRAQGFRAHFLDEGLRVTPRETSVDDWEFGLSLTGYGRGAEALSVAAGTPRADRKRVRYQRGPLVEWYVNDRRGLEQGFTLDAPPRTGRRHRGRAFGARSADPSRATEPVYVVLRVDGDARPNLAADRQSILFEREDSPLAIARYDHLEVLDATGRTLDAWMEVFRDEEGHGIRLVFDDEGARYPVEIDPLLSSASWSVVGNQSPGNGQTAEGLGFAVTGAGDVNGDGFDDVLVGAPFFDGGARDTGRVYLFLGSPAGLSATPSWFAIGESPLGTRAPGPVDTRFGFTVTGAGDVDDDGYDDFVVARVPATFLEAIPASPEPGQVYLYRGSPTGPGDIADWTMEGRPGRRLGMSIDLIGGVDPDPTDGITDFDLNGDGYADLAIGEPGRVDVNDEGRVYVFYGQADGLLGGGTHCDAAPEGPAGLSCDGTAIEPGVPAPQAWSGPDRMFGHRLAGAGDMDCDGIGDLVLGQPRWNSNDEGLIQLYRGGSAGVDTSAPIFQDRGLSFETGIDNIELGRSFAPARFATDDPSVLEVCGDLLVGAPGLTAERNTSSPIPRAGAIVRLTGRRTSPLPAPAVIEWPPFDNEVIILEGKQVRENLGVSMANVGDVNGDGEEDFLVGAPGERGHPTSPGRAYLFLRGQTQSAGSDVTDIVWRGEGETVDDHLGNSVAGAGDVNGDTFRDILVGSPTGRDGLAGTSLSNPFGAGAAFAYYGTLPSSLASLLGLTSVDVQGDPACVLNAEACVLDSYAWSGDAAATLSAVTEDDLAAGVGAGPNPNSLLISTGFAEEEGRGASDVGNNPSQEDYTFAAMVLDVPANAKTLRFTTQYVTADPDQNPRNNVLISFEHDETEAGDVFGRPGSNGPPGSTLVLETPIEEIGRGGVHNPISHAIDVGGGVSTIGLQVNMVEQSVPGLQPDSAVILSKVFFSDVPLPDYLSPIAPGGNTSDPGYLAECAALDVLDPPSIPYGLDQNDNCVVDNVANPLPSDLTEVAGSFRFGQTLMSVPGKLIDFDFAINYSSARTREEELGPKWTHTFDASLEESPDFDETPDGCPDSVYVRTGGGNIEVFRETETASSSPGPCEFEPASPGNYSSLVADPAPGVDYVLRTKDNFFSDFIAESPGSDEHRRAFIAHPIGHAIFTTHEGATGRIDYVTDSRGEQYDFTYDTSFDPARLVSVAGTGAQVLFDYNELGFLTSVTDANGDETSFTYDDDGKILTVTDGDGTRVVSNEYESVGGLSVGQSGDRVVLQENGTPGDPGLVTEYTGDSVMSVDREGSTQLDRYDVFGRLVDRRVLLGEGLGNDLRQCDLASPPSWCAASMCAYDSDGQLIRDEDPNGFETLREYDDLGNLICQTDEVELATQQVRSGWVYDERNNVVAQLLSRDPDDLPACPPPIRVPSLGGDPLANIPAGDLPKWYVTTRGYNALPSQYDLLVSQTDPQGRTTDYARYPRSSGASLEPERGLLQSITDPLGRTRSFTYDSLGHLRTETNALGAVTQYGHDLMGRQTSVTDARGNASTAMYDAGGRLVAALDPLFASQSFTYDAQGRQLTRTDQAFGVWTKTYTPTGKLATESDPLGNTTRFGYDGEDRLVSIESPRGPETPDAGDFQTTRSYDAAGRLIETVDARGGISSFEYDAAGNRTARTDARNNRTSFAYDGLDRAIRKRDARGIDTLYEYDTRGLLTKRTDPGAREWSRTYTDSGRLASIEDPEGVTTTFTYDLADQLDLLSQPATGREVDHDYDLAGRLTEITVRAAGEVLATASATYDAVGNNTAVVDPNGQLLEFEYDALNRLSLERDALGNEVAYAYDARSLPSGRTNARSAPGALSTLAYDLDAAGRATGVDGVEPGYDWSIQETLDRAGNAVAKTGTATDSSRVPASVTRVFDETDLPTERTVELASGLSRTVRSEYDEVGNLSAVIYSDDVTRVDYTYDELNRLVSAVYTDGVETQQTTYQYALDNLFRVDRPDGSFVTLFNDSASRLERVLDRDQNIATIFDAQFTLDGAGRRTDATFVLPLEPTAEPDATFTYNEANRLVSRNGSDTFTYDEDGNLVSGAIGGSTRSLGYNALNQLVDVDGEVIRYDADGLRVQRIEGGVTTYYLYDTEGRLLEELDAAGNVIARYVHGLGLISRTTGGETSVYHYDSRGSTVALTDIDGNITDRYAYTPYGGVQHAPGNSTPNPFTYNGRDGVVDDGNGLYYMEARYYSPELMRFVQKDPVYGGELNNPQSLNRYAFVEGNPVEYVDPSGELGFLASIGLGAAVGFVVGGGSALLAGDDLETILTTAAAGAVAGALIGSGQVGAASVLLGGAVGAGFAAGTGASAADIVKAGFIGGAVGGASGFGIGAAFGAGAIAGFVDPAEGRSFEARLESAAFGGVGAGLFGGAGRKASGALSRTGVGRYLGSSKLGRITSRSFRSLSRARSGPLLPSVRQFQLTREFGKFGLKKGASFGRFLGRDLLDEDEGAAGGGVATAAEDVFGPDLPTGSGRGRAVIATCGG